MALKLFKRSGSQGTAGNRDTSTGSADTRASLPFDEDFNPPPMSQAAADALDTMLQQCRYAFILRQRDTWTPSQQIVDV